MSRRNVKAEDQSKENHSIHFHITYITPELPIDQPFIQSKHGNSGKAPSALAASHVIANQLHRNKAKPL